MSNQIPNVDSARKNLAHAILKPNSSSSSRGVRGLVTERLDEIARLIVFPWMADILYLFLKPVELDGNILEPCLETLAVRPPGTHDSALIVRGRYGCVRRSVAEN